jgi:ribosomal protein S6
MSTETKKGDKVLKYMITNTKAGEYQVMECKANKPSTYSTIEEAEAAIEEILGAISARGESGGKSYKDLTKEINKKNREANNKKTTREYRLKK